MPAWKNCRVDVLFYDGTPADQDDRSYEVRIDDPEIVVSHPDGEGGWVSHRGRNDGTDHFERSAPQIGGRASLHRFPGGKILEGTWFEAGERGMWRITLE